VAHLAWMRRNASLSEALNRLARRALPEPSWSRSATRVQAVQRGGDAGARTPEMMPMPGLLTATWKGRRAYRAICLVSVQQRNRYLVSREFAGQRVSDPVALTYSDYAAAEDVVASHERVVNRGGEDLRRPAAPRLWCSVNPASHAQRSAALTDMPAPRSLRIPVAPHPVGTGSWRRCSLPCRRSRRRCWWRSSYRRVGRA
jgi:hypothetical protein